MRDATRSVHHPNISEEGYAALGVPTHRASTIVFPDAEAYATRSQRDLDGYSYGLHGTPTQRVLEAQLSALENGLKTVILPSGQAAIAVLLLSCLKPGDHVLVADNAYPPVIGLCRNFLEPRGIEWSVFEPGIGAGVEGDVRDNTRLIWMESPGSTTMEIEDVPVITAIAKRRGILTGIDNTWATPLLFKPLDHGVDFSMQALTKYPGGHSDLLMGSVSVNDLDLRKALRDTMRMLGFGVSPDAVQLVLRGLDAGALASVRATMADNPDDYVIFPATPYMDALTPAVRHGDDQWLDIVTWSIQAMIAAEAFGLSSENIDDYLDSDDPRIRRFLGTDPGNGAALGLSDDFAYRIVKSVGNYAEVYDRNVGMDSPLKLERGHNALFNDGGLMFPLAFQ
ncbi:PLP-dependent transferase [Martelella sp. FLE1502]